MATEKEVFGALNRLENDTSLGWFIPRAKKYNRKEDCNIIREYIKTQNSIKEAHLIMLKLATVSLKNLRTKAKRIVTQKNNLFEQIEYLEGRLRSLIKANSDLFIELKKKEKNDPIKFSNDK